MIKMKIKALIFISTLGFLSIIGIKSVQAAPAQWGIAINPITDECAGYWAGDEYSYYSLPSGWVAYYPDTATSSEIVTPNGTCNFEFYNAKTCCDELNLDYVSSNIGNYYDDNYDPDYNYDYYDEYNDIAPLGVLGSLTASILIPICCCCCCGSFVIILIVFVVVLVRKR